MLLILLLLACQRGPLCTWLPLLLLAGWGRCSGLLWLLLAS
jgi:hypothetical protein